MSQPLRRVLPSLLAAWGLSAAAQSNIPSTFQALDQAAVAEACFYEMQVFGYLSYVLWESTKDELHRQQMIRAALAAQVWRGRAAKVSSGGMERSLLRGRAQSEAEKAAQIQYCGQTATSYMAALTPAQKQDLATRTRTRILQLPEGMRAR